MSNMWRKNIIVKTIKCKNE